MLNTVGRTKLRDVVAQQLKQYILASDLKPGDRLPTETELATIFGVSRPSVREATKSLEYLGIVEAKSGRGLFVGSVNLDHVVGCIGFHPALQTVPPLELIGTRVVLEIGALHYVCAAMQQDPSVYDRLNEINARFRAATEVPQFIAYDIEFHRGMALASGLSPLLPFMDVVEIFFKRFRESVEQSVWAVGADEHQSIIDSLRDGDVLQATKILRSHIECHRERL